MRLQRECCELFECERVAGHDLRSAIVEEPLAIFASGPVAWIEIDLRVAGAIKIRTDRGEGVSPNLGRDLNQRYAVAADHGYSMSCKGRLKEGQVSGRRNRMGGNLDQVAAGSRSPIDNELGDIR